MDKNRSEIFIYSTPDCQYCNRAKAYLKEHGLEFTSFDVSKDQARAREMFQISGQGSIPTLVINGRIVVGFDPQLIDGALSKPKPPKREVALQNLIYDPFEQ